MDWVILTSNAEASRSYFEMDLYTILTILLCSKSKDGAAKVEIT